MKRVVSGEGRADQFGRLVLVFEDGAGFISHYHLMDRDASDTDVVVEETREAQEKHQGQIETALFDRGFYRAENEQELSKIIEEACLAPRHPGQFAERWPTLRWNSTAYANGIRASNPPSAPCNPATA